MKLTVTILLLAFTQTIFAQSSRTDESNSKIGITTSFGKNDIAPPVGLVGGPSYTGKSFIGFGLNYLKTINKTFDFETGLEYTHHNYSISPAPNPAPGIDRTPKKESISLLTLPISVRVNFLRYFFVNGGGLLDLETNASGSSVDAQTGIGLMLGAGAKYNFNNGISVFANPNIRIHGLLPFSSQAFHKNDKLLEAGFRIGVTYSLK